MFTTLADTYMTASRIGPIVGYQHPETTRIAILAAQREAKKARAAELLREHQARLRREAVRRFAGRLLTGAGERLVRAGRSLAAVRAAPECC